MKPYETLYRGIEKGNAVCLSTIWLRNVIATVAMNALKEKVDATSEMQNRYGPDLVGRCSCQTYSRPIETTTPLRTNDGGKPRRSSGTPWSSTWCGGSDGIWRTAECTPPIYRTGSMHIA